jgi:hypothetical protein
MTKVRLGVASLVGFSILLSSASLAFAQTTAANSGPASVGSTLETHINNDGTVLVRGAKITSINGSTINATQTWGSYNVSWVVNTNTSTKFTRRFGGDSSLGEFTVGDYISFSGTLDTTQPQGTVTAKVVKDYSVQKVNATFSGTVQSINSGNTSFVLATPNRGDVTVFVSTTTSIKVGNATTTFSSLAVGQKITKADGIWDNLSNTLAAQHVVIYQNTGLLNRRTFDGTLVSIGSSSAPTSFTYKVGQTTFTVNVATNTQILSNNWSLLPLSSLKANDHVHVYGAVESNSSSTIDAYVIRDVSVK